MTQKYTAVAVLCQNICSFGYQPQKKSLIRGIVGFQSLGYKF